MFLWKPPANHIIHVTVHVSVCPGSEGASVSSSPHFTQNMLASALSAITSHTSSSSPHSLPTQLGEGPSSLTADTSEPVPAADGPQSLPSHLDPEQVGEASTGSGPSSLPTGSSASGGIGISALSLQAALSNVQVSYLFEQHGANQCS